jgi:hypothetical protein
MRTYLRAYNTYIRHSLGLRHLALSVSFATRLAGHARASPSQKANANGQTKEREREPHYQNRYSVSLHCIQGTGRIRGRCLASFRVL